MRLHVFDIGPIPVHADPWFLALLVYFGYRAPDLPTGIILVVAAILALLVHELGHAVVALGYELSPAIVLHAWGGLCVHRPAPTARASALVTAAGPGAGLAPAAALAAVSALVVRIDPDFFRNGPIVTALVDQLVALNLGWSLLNAIPLWPLDGGQLLRVGVLQVAPGFVVPVVHGTGVVLAGLLAFSSFAWGQPLTGVIGLMLALQNVQALSTLTKVQEQT
jgi:stage IV sporulation protein FB